MSVVTREADGAVAIVRLNRADVLNALSEALTSELAEVLDAIEADEDIRAMVLTGSGKHFAAGADIQEMLEMHQMDVFTADFTGCCERLSRCRKPVVAAVEGYALGGGCELVEMCDIVVAARGARFGHPEVKLGVMPGAGGSQRLARCLGKYRAMDLLLTGRQITGEEAERLGLVSRLVEDGQALNAALEIAAELAETSAVATQALKESVNAAFDCGLSEGIVHERRLFHLTFGSEDRREGMQAFLDKRRPVFRHR